MTQCDNKSQLQAVGNLLGSHALIDWEIYLETRWQGQIRSYEKMLRTEQSLIRGIHVRYFQKDHGWRMLNASGISTQDLADWLQLPVLKSYPPSTFALPPTPQWDLKIWDEFNRMMTRFSRFQEINQLRTVFECQKTQGVVVNSQCEPRLCSDRSNHFQAQWWVSKHSRNPQFFEQSYYQRDARQLLGVVERELPAKIEQSSQKVRPWPAPSGDIPVVWSSTATAKLVLPLLQHFEGDRVLSKQSLLARWPQTPLSFELSEVPLQTQSYDAEGAERKLTHLIAGGFPKNILSNLKTSHQLQTQNSANARRASYHQAPTIGSWCCLLEPRNERVADLLASVDGGIFVEDIQVTEAQNPEQLLVHLHDAYLIQGGKIGDAIEPITLKLGVIECCELLDSFSEKSDVVGLKFEKQGQSFLTELVTPQAFSQRIKFHGSVPTSYYW